MKQPNERVEYAVNKERLSIIIKYVYNGFFYEDKIENVWVYNIENNFLNITTSDNRIISYNLSHVVKYQSNFRIEKRNG